MTHQQIKVAFPIGGALLHTGDLESRPPVAAGKQKSLAVQSFNRLRQKLAAGLPIGVVRIGTMGRVKSEESAALI